MHYLVIELDSTLITAIVTAIVTVGLFILKETIDNARNRRQSKQQKVDTFRAYTDPLKDASILLYDRLKEIFEKRAKFLYRKAPKNHFNKYRYISTLYRLCVVLGWVRAVKKELSGMDLDDHIKLQGIENSIKAFQRSLYDNQFMEGERIRYLSRAWGFDLNELEEHQHDEMEEEIAQYIWAELAKHDKVYARELDTDKQQIIAKKICEIISNHCGSDMPDDQTFDNSHQDVIRAISRTEAWIYLDWQNAIGEIMLVPTNGMNAMRSFQVSGFEEFEDMYLEFDSSARKDDTINDDDHNKQRVDDHIRNRWIGRIDRLFKHLNMNSLVTHDARIQQLRNVGSTLLVMIEEMEKLASIGDYKPSKRLLEFQKFDREESNPEFYKELNDDVLKIDTPISLR